MNKKQVMQIIQDTNNITNNIGKDITNKVNNDNSLDTFFGKWLVATSEFEKRYTDVAIIQKLLRELGYDVKINMQSYELSYHGIINK